MKTETIVTLTPEEKVKQAFVDAFTLAQAEGFNIKTAAPGLPGPSGPYVIALKDLTFEPIGTCLTLPLVKERATSA
jgi:hypothetical protein